MKTPGRISRIAPSCSHIGAAAYRIWGADIRGQCDASKTGLSADQPLRDSVRDVACGIATGFALIPHLDQAPGNLRDAGLDFGGVAVAQIFEADVDDTAGVDDVIGRVEDAACM